MVDILGLARELRVEAGVRTIPTDDQVVALACTAGVDFPIAHEPLYPPATAILADGQLVLAEGFGPGPDDCLARRWRAVLLVAAADVRLSGDRACHLWHRIPGHWEGQAPEPRTAALAGWLCLAHLAATRDLWQPAETLAELARLPVWMVALWQRELRMRSAERVEWELRRVGQST